MPDISDLHDAFARLEQEIPENYRSPVIAERVSQLLGQTDHRARGPRPWAVAATALLAAAAVVVVAVAAVTLSRHGSGDTPVGNQPTSGQSRTPVPSTSPTTSASPQASTQHSPPNSHGAMPASRSALLTYVSGARLVNASEYQRGEPGPGQAMQPTPGLAEFNTPSGNITCAMLDLVKAGDVNVVCQAQQFSFYVPPKPASCQNDWAAYFGFVARGQVSVGACVGGPEFGPTTMTLPYGSAIEQGGIACRSESGFLACADLTTGHGFAVNRDVLKTY